MKRYIQELQLHKFLSRIPAKEKKEKIKTAKERDTSNHHADCNWRSKWKNEKGKSHSRSMKQLRPDFFSPLQWVKTGFLLNFLNKLSYSNGLF